MKLTNPYPSPGDDCCRITANVPRKIYERIRCLYLDKGAIQNIINQLIQKLLTACEQRNLTTSADSDKFVEFLTTAILIDGRSNSTIEYNLSAKPDTSGKLSGIPGGSTLPSPAGKDVRRRTPRVGHTVA